MSTQVVTPPAQAGTTPAAATPTATSTATSTPKGLTQEQLDAFSKDGYLSIGRVLSDEEIELYRREYDGEFAKAQQSNQYNNLASNSTSNEAAVKQAAPQKMLQIINMCDRNIHFRRLVHHPKILDMVQEIIGPNIMLFHDQALFKPAHHGGPIFWHQDNGYWKCRPANLVSCWLTLDDVDVHNGAMQVIPGSHLAPAWHDKAAQTGVLLESKGVDTSKAVVVDLPAGGCMFHHCQTLHYTAPNTTPRQRRAFAIHFMVPGTSSVHNGQMGVDFSHPMLRARL